MNHQTEIPKSVSHRGVLALALPIIVANISTPMLGAVDTAVVGQLGDPAQIGAIAIGGLIFAFMFWGLAFLRMGTAGLTAHACGADAGGDRVAKVLGLALWLAVVLAGLLLVLQLPIASISFYILQAEWRVEELARQYYDIRIWSAPFALLNYVLLGWLIGMGRVKEGLLLQVLLNGLNIVFDMVLVLGYGMDVAGVALGTVMAEGCATLVGLWLVRPKLKMIGQKPLWWVFDKALLKKMLMSNVDIMIRTLCLIFAFAWLINQSAMISELTLAANSILLIFLEFSAFILDGFAIAAERLVGVAMGSRNIVLFDQAVWVSTLWAVVMAIIMCGLIALIGEWMIDVITVDESVRHNAKLYLYWAIVMPLIAVWCFQLDGIFIGSVETEAMRNTMLLALLCYLLAWWLTRDYANYGLWSSFMVLYVARTIFLGSCYPRLRQRLVA